MTATSGGSAKTHLEDGIKALESGDKEGAMTQLTAAQQAIQGSSPDAIMHLKARNESVGRWRFERRNYAFEGCRSISGLSEKSTPSFFLSESLHL